MRIRKNITWPVLPSVDLKNLSRTMAGFVQFLRELRLAIDARDRELVRAVNAADIEIVTSAPSGTPDYGEPCLVLYDDGSDWHLYAYVGDDGWKYVTLT